MTIAIPSFFCLDVTSPKETRTSFTEYTNENEGMMNTINKYITRQLKGQFHQFLVCP